MIANVRYIMTFDKQKEADVIEYFERQNEEFEDKWIVERGSIAVSFRREDTYYVPYGGKEDAES